MPVSACVLGPLVGSGSVVLQLSPLQAWDTSLPAASYDGNFGRLVRLRNVQMSTDGRARE